MPAPLSGSPLKVLRGESWFPQMGVLRTLMRAVFPLSPSELHAFATGAHRAGTQKLPTADIRHPSWAREAELKVRRHLLGPETPARLPGHLSYEMPLVGSPYLCIYHSDDILPGWTVQLRITTLRFDGSMVQAID